MKDPRSISISDFTYVLPEASIAKYPLEKRDDSQLLLYRNGNIEKDFYRNLSTHLPENSLLVFNNTKVVEARLLFQKSSGGMIEIFCLEPDERYTDITTAMCQKERVYWKCLIGGASKWKAGQILEKPIADTSTKLFAKFVEKKFGAFIVELFWNNAHLSFAEILHLTGATPLPPYLKRSAEENDKERYQTIYAKFDGSVAAPTAGLHFTETIFQSLQKKNIQKAFVTLHVGAGTFKPVYAPTMQEHEMHAEWIDVSAFEIERILNTLPENNIAVGTTSLRTLESLYWLGVKSMSATSSCLTLTQWEAYELDEKNINPAEALNSLLSWMHSHQLERLITKTQIIIAPGYRFKIIKGLITNFHQPQSTLLLLVAALIGNDWKKVYEFALQNNFRFLSYGDGSLLWLNQ